MSATQNIDDVKAQIREKYAREDDETFEDVDEFSACSPISYSARSEDDETFDDVDGFSACSPCT